MGAETAIAWTDSTFNPWWGCTKIDAACVHCYADTLDRRYGGGHWGPHAQRRTFGEKHWNEPLKWEREAAKDGVRRRVFCGSMCDWADILAPAGAVEQLWDLIRRTPHLDWLLLTKRADRIEQLLPKDWGDGYQNVWQGVTVGDQAGRWRLDHLTRIRARVRFVSVEPLLEPLDLSKWLAVRDTGHGPAPSWELTRSSDGEGTPLLHWVIVGAESGPKARPMAENWVRGIRDQCVASGAGFFYKQQVTNGGLRKIETPQLDGRRWVDPPTGIAPRARDLERERQVA